MKTVHVKTKRIVSYGGGGQPIFETINQKVRSNGVNDDFEQLVAILPVVGYTEAVVIGVFTLKPHAPVDEIEEYQKIVDASLNPQPEEEIEDVTAIVEENKQLKESMAQIMARLDAMENKAPVSEPLKANDDAEYKAELKAEIKALGGKLQGLITIDQLEKRLSELNNED
tara:strand:+ start:1591 stop:2100 length:510 start_codon:yes stop_codon:yes gene_type:complete